MKAELCLFENTKNHGFIILTESPEGGDSPKPGAERRDSRYNNKKEP
jgi:hypothetical protein